MIYGHKKPSAKFEKKLKGAGKVMGRATDSYMRIATGVKRKKK